MRTYKRQQGFALILTLVVVSIVLAVGLSMLTITLKQFTLSGTARDSEMAFHAADAGLECMQYYRNNPSYRTILLNDDVDPDTEAPVLSCAGFSQLSSDTNHYLPGPSNGNMYNYVYQYDIDSTQCIETSMYLIDMRESDGEFSRTVNEGLETLSCGPGVVCTTIFARGYNRGCSNLNSIRVVQREITIQF